uniref:MHD domain-containing protein n=1 Tax=Aegilops tauschii subsp. strangulata TaxID=200361 RepID=A0A453PAX7_AEGTS
RPGRFILENTHEKALLDGEDDLCSCLPPPRSTKTRAPPIPFLLLTVRRAPSAPDRPLRPVAGGAPRNRAPVKGGGPRRSSRGAGDAETMPVAASAIYFLNLRGDVLINRLYRDDVGGNMVDAFRMHIMQTKELGTCPVRQIGGCSFLYMRISNVYIVIVVSSNANVSCAFKFVVEAVALFKSYFGGTFDEDAIRNNFVLIYELLDGKGTSDFGLSLLLQFPPWILFLFAILTLCNCAEIMDFGYPQNLSPEILKLYITQEGVRSPFSSKPSDKPVPNATLQVTGAVGWRREGLVYKKNEVFLDIVESVNLLMSSKGSVLRCDVTGKILMKCFLSGMPDLKLGLNDKIGLEKEAQLKSRPSKSGKTIELDDVTFHQCVNLTRFNSEKTVSFVPPDGEFELMKYRITEGVNLPFRVLPTIKELGRTRMEINVKVKSVFGAKMFALGVVVKVPVPKQTAKTSFQTTSGKAKYNASIDSLVWKIRKFPGQTEATMSAEVELISTMGEKKLANRPPIQMEFQVPMFTASGLRVRFLKVWEKSGYNTVEWVRYISRAGS